VVVRARIDAGGRVDAARVVRELGSGLDQNAVVAVRQWRFRPGTRNGVAVPMDVEIQIAFTRRTDAINAQIANDMVSLVGPKEHVRDRLQAYRDAGVGTLMSTPLAFTADDRSRMMRELAEMAA